MRKKSLIYTLIFFCIIGGILVIGFSKFLVTTLIANLSEASLVHYSNEFRLYGALLSIVGLTFLIYFYLQGELVFSSGFLKKATNIVGQLGIPVAKLNSGEVLPDSEESRFAEKNKKFEIVDVRIRLSKEISMTRRTLSINLSIGFLTTAVAIYLLSMTLFTQDAIKSSSDLYKYLPRVTLAIFIELFSFFFLKIYKRNLEDIKYLINEITTFESKMIALNYSKDLQNKELQKIVVKSFCDTERNFVLKKGESTVELQRLKLEENGQEDLLNKLVKLLDTKTK